MRVPSKWNHRPISRKTSRRARRARIQRIGSPSRGRPGLARGLHRSEAPMNLPNKLTVARCVMAFLFVGLMSFEHVLTYFLAFAVFVAAALTDFLDGRIARARGLITNFGKLLDPVADKLLMVAGFVMLITVRQLWIPAWTLVVIFGREFLVTGVRGLAASEGSVLPANNWGKAKTVVQMTYVGVFLFLVALLQLLDSRPEWHGFWPEGTAWFEFLLGWSSWIGILLVAVYTVYSGVQFTWENRKRLNLTF